MSNESLDPRVQRLDLHREENDYQTTFQWITFEVFHQQKRGKQPTHVGIVHAPSPDLALVFAKEQYGRRGITSNIWVVKSSDVYMFPQEDEDMFSTIPDKQFREPGAYKVRDKINAYKERQG
ncbi:MAG: 1,2-phenylacetyl-CoA epoxidase subunit B [Chitinophagales bacterium]|nr:1,2-phenylacetyl-CoA epoxidase subunit B [Chitinophagales bacterium]